MLFPSSFRHGFRSDGPKMHELMKDATGNPKQTAKPLSVTEKQLPPYGMDIHELVYPGEGSPFPITSPENSRLGGAHHAGTPAHPAAPQTEVPMKKIQPGAATTAALLKALTVCATACERCIAACQSMKEPHRFTDCIATGKACADVCILLHSLASTLGRSSIAFMAMDLAPVCARACETCALECSKHPSMEACITCEQACRASAGACRKFAQ